MEQCGGSQPWLHIRTAQKALNTMNAQVPGPKINGTGIFRAPQVMVTLGQG